MSTINPNIKSFKHINVHHENGGTVYDLDIDNNHLDKAIWYLFCAKEHQSFSNLPTDITRMELGLDELKKAIVIAEKKWE